MSDQLRLIGSIVLILVLIGLLLVLAAWPIVTAKKRGHASQEAITVCTIVGLFIWPAWIVALIWAYTGPDNGARERDLIARKKAESFTRAFPVGSTGRKRYDQEEKPAPASEDAYAAMIAGAPAARSQPPAASSVKRYRIDGIDKESKMETTGFYEASTEANARAKAELDGILVTACTREVVGV